MSNIVFNPKLGLYIKTIRVANHEVKMVAKRLKQGKHGNDLTEWQASFIGAAPAQMLNAAQQLVPTALIAPVDTKAMVREHIMKRQPTRKRVPMLQGGNYHPPRVEKTLRKKYVELDQKASLIAAYPNGKNCVAVPNKDGGPLYGKK